MALSIAPLVQAHVRITTRKVVVFSATLVVLGTILSYFATRERPFEKPGIFITALVAGVFGLLILGRVFLVWFDIHRLRQLLAQPQRICWVYPVDLVGKYGSHRGSILRLRDIRGEVAELAVTDVPMAMAICQTVLPHALFGYTAHNRQMYQLATGQELVGV